MGGDSMGFMYYVQMKVMVEVPCGTLEPTSKILIFM